MSTVPSLITFKAAFAYRPQYVKYLPWVGGAVALIHGMQDIDKMTTTLLKLNPNSQIECRIPCFEQNTKPERFPGKI